MEKEVISSSITEVYTVKGVSKRLKLSESKIRQLVRENRMPYFRIDRSVRFHEPEIQKWIPTLVVQPANQPSQDAAKRADEILKRGR